MPKLPPATNKLENELYEAVAFNEKPSRTYLGMSSIGAECDRSLWLNFRQFAPIGFDGRILMLFEFGNIIEDLIVSYLKLAGYKVEGQQEAFSAHEGFFRGHSDGTIYGITKNPHILEIKSCNAKKFNQFKKNGVKKIAPQYYCQVQCYMGYANLKHALFVIQCKNDSKIYTERVYFNRTDFNFLHDRAGKIIFANNIPDKIEHSITCDWCDQRYNCDSLEVANMHDTTCGNCHYHNWVGTKNFCMHEKHLIEIKQWGACCSDWEYRYIKGKHDYEKISVDVARDRLKIPTKSIIL